MVLCLEHVLVIVAAQPDLVLKKLPWHLGAGFDKQLARADVSHLENIARCRGKFLGHGCAYL